ncbi:hypothetical protein O181_063737 [Austropuccinia psidii MF-1]|uniref:Reverse transcriptase Ty1/copia-type domain-containing protein n=1 Tax=Austropuccinia psidii MF-1 TaxID=1389203 RepID=A0A9Q3I1N2_9BASI|nr:hypothetical protein [Austropuccinia psidii MF-1]
MQIDQHFLADKIVSAYQRPVVHKFNQLPDKILASNNSDAIDTSFFQSTIGLLMYLSNGTRSNISYAVHLLARHPHLSLSYGNTGEGFDLWADANWEGENQKSTSGYLIKAFGNIVAWGSKRQTVVAISTCAAEYIALSEGTQCKSNN